MSATVRLAQPVSFCQDGLASYAEQPEPAPPFALFVEPHTASTQPRVDDDDLVSDVPPTAVTSADDAGYSTP